jgi:pimeloyl-ACP methyl ester carboxylesterase
MFGPIERTLIYHPVRSTSLAPPDASLPNAEMRSIRVPASQSGLELNGWYFEPCERGSGLLTLFFPGNGGNRAYRLPEIDVLINCGTAVLIVDYRGYGDNPGSPSESAIAADVRAIWNFAISELGIPNERIVLYGESLGGGVATRLAAEVTLAGTPPAALILRSTFSRLTDVAREHYPWLPVRLVMGERYPSIDRITQVTAPILIIHGERDRIVAFPHGCRLFEAAPDHAADGTPKQFVALPNSDHNDVLSTESELFHKALEEFYARLRTGCEHGARAG